MAIELETGVIDPDIIFTVVAFPVSGVDIYDVCILLFSVLKISHCLFSQGANRLFFISILYMTKNMKGEFYG